MLRWAVLLLASVCLSEGCQRDFGGGHVPHEAAGREMGAADSDDAASHLAIRQERDGSGNLGVYLESDDVDRKIGCTVVRTHPGNAPVRIVENKVLPGEKRFVEYNAQQNTYSIEAAHYETGHLGDARPVVEVTQEHDAVGSTSVYVTNNGSRNASCTIEIEKVGRPWRQKLPQNLLPGEKRFLEYNNDQSTYIKKRAWYE